MGLRQLEAKKLEYDCPPTPKPTEEGKPACRIHRPRPIFQLFGVYCIFVPPLLRVFFKGNLGFRPLARAGFDGSEPFRSMVGTAAQRLGCRVCEEIPWLHQAHTSHGLLRYPLLYYPHPKMGLVGMGVV